MILSKAQQARNSMCVNSSPMKQPYFWLWCRRKMGGRVDLNIIFLVQGGKKKCGVFIEMYNFWKFNVNECVLRLNLGVL